MGIWTLALSAREKVSKVEFADAKGRQGSDMSAKFLTRRSINKPPAPGMEISPNRFCTLMSAITGVVMQ